MRGKTQLHAREPREAQIGQFSRSMALVELPVLLSERFLSSDHGLAGLIRTQKRRAALALRQPAQTTYAVPRP